MSYLHYLCLFAYCGVQHILCCIPCLRLVYPMLPVYLDCPFLIASSVSLMFILYKKCLKKNQSSTVHPVVSLRKDRKIALLLYTDKADGIFFLALFKNSNY